MAASTLADEEPETAWRHARAARARGGRIGVVRETVGLVAYRAGEWAEAIGELRAARRMGGGPGHLAVLADCERALGHPEKAIELSRSAEADELDQEASIELSIVVAGARADLDQVDVALAQLERLGLDKAEVHPRLAYAYADLLLKAGREQEALSWFIKSANADAEEETDALDRVAEFGDEESPAENGASSPAAQQGDPLDDEDLELSPGFQQVRTALGVETPADPDSAPADAAGVSGGGGVDESGTAEPEQLDADATADSADEDLTGDGVQGGVVPNEDVPVENVPVENVPVENVPVENVPVENVPVEDVTVENVPDEDVTDEDVTENVPDGAAPEEGVTVVPPLLFSDDTQAGDR